jgi:hypothetical protein
MNETNSADLDDSSNVSFSLLFCRTRSDGKFARSARKLSKIQKIEKRTF